MRNQEKRLSLLREVFDDLRVNEASGEVFLFCQNGCHETKRKLQVNVNRNVYRCWVCNDHGSIFQFLKKYVPSHIRKLYLETIDFGSEIQFDDEKSEEKVVSLPSEFSPLVTCSKSFLGRKAVQHLSKFNINEKEILQFKIGICDDGSYKNRIMFPSFDVNGRLNFFLGRSLWDEAYQKYVDAPIQKRFIIFNEFMIDWNKPIILVENVRAHIRHSIIGNVVPINGSYAPNKRHRILEQASVNDVPKVYVCLDPEERAKSLKIAEEFGKFSISCDIVTVPVQPDELDTENFVDCLLSAEPYNEDTALEQQIINL